LRAAPAVQTVAACGDAVRDAQRSDLVVPRGLGAPMGASGLAL